MTPERWQKIGEIFDSALRLAPERRAAFLDGACAGDAELRREVESLIARDGPEDFLGGPTAAGAARLLAEMGEGSLEGRQLGAYKILSLLGAGGMGEVYLAEDTRLERRIALKILPEKLATDRERMQRFVREAKSASALNHPNIITIYEIGETDKTHFIATEYIEGDTLRERLKGAPVNLKSALEIAVQVASALDAAHRAGIVHRDVKPENVMIRPDGLVKLLDFGIAKLTEKRNEIDSEAATIKAHTTPGMIIGTAAYMSPEQARGLEVDVRTDIFSLGVVLYEMLTGRVPFAGETTGDVIAAILKTEAAPPTNFNQEIPGELERIISKTLAKDRGERYQTANDLLIDLRRLKQQLEVQAGIERATPPGKIQNERATRILAARPRSIALKPLALLGALALVATAVWFMRPRHESFADISVQKVAQITNSSGLDDFPSLSPDGNAVAYCSDQKGSFEIYVKQLTPGAKEIQLTNDGGQNFQPAWSPDGQRIAYYSKLRGGIWIIPASGGEAKQLTEFGSHPAWSPDGKQIAFQSNQIVDLGAYARNALPPSTLWLVGANGGEPKQLTQIGNPAGGHGSPSFSPDGKRIVFEVDDYQSSSVWTISTGGDDAKRISKAGNAYEPVYAPDGQSILHSSDGVFQVRVNPDTNDAIGESSQIAGIGGTFSGVRRVSFSADGRKMAYSALLRRESLLSVRLQTNSTEADGAPAPLIQNTNARNHYPAFSPDGKRIAFSSCNVGGTGCDIWLADADGSHQIQLTTHESAELMPSWFPDMEQVAYISNRTGHWMLWAINLNTKREKMLLDLTESLEYARLSPDGKQVVFNFKRGGAINVWTASLAGGEPKQLTFDKELMGFPLWSPDGKYIAFQMMRGDDTHIMVMPSEGGTPTQLTFDKGQSWTYGWSPDGDKILFAGFRDGLWNVWWVSRSTKEQRRLTDYKKLNSFVRYPSWSPKGDQVVYEYSETTGNIWVAELK